MKLKETIELINNSEELYYISRRRQWRRANPQPRHRAPLRKPARSHHETATSYFQLEDGILGIEGLSNVYSELMLASDCDVNCYAFEGEEIKTVSYKPKIEN